MLTLLTGQPVLDFDGFVRFFGRLLTRRDMLAAEQRLLAADSFVLRELVAEKEQVIAGKDAAIAAMQRQADELAAASIRKNEDLHAHLHALELVDHERDALIKKTSAQLDAANRELSKAKTSLRERDLQIEALNTLLEGRDAPPPKAVTPTCGEADMDAAVRENVELRSENTSLLQMLEQLQQQAAEDQDVHQRMEARISQLTDECATMREQLDFCQQRIEELRSENETLRRDSNDLLSESSIRPRRDSDATSLMSSWSSSQRGGVGAFSRDRSGTEADNMLQIELEMARADLANERVRRQQACDDKAAVEQLLVQAELRCKEVQAESAKQRDELQAKMADAVHEHARELMRLQGEMDSLRVACEAARAECSEERKSAGSLQEQLASAMARCRDQQAAMASMTLSLAQTRTEMENLQQQLTAAATSQATLQQLLTQRDGDLAAAKRDLASALSSSCTSQQLELVQAQLSDALSKLMLAEADVAVMAKRVAKSEEELAALTADMDRSRREVSEVRAQMADAARMRAEAEHARDEQSRALGECMQRMAKMESDALQGQVKMQCAEQNASELRAQLEQLQMRIRSLEDSQTDQVRLHALGQAALDDAETRLHDLRKKLALGEEQLLAMTRERDGARAAVAQAEVVAMQRSSQLAALEQGLAAARDEVVMQQGKCEGLQQEMAKMAAEMAQRDACIAQLEGQVAGGQRALDKADEETQRLSRVVEESEEHLRKLQHQLLTSTGESRRLESQLAEARLENSQLVQKLKDQDALHAAHEMELSELRLFKLQADSEIRALEDAVRDACQQAIDSKAEMHALQGSVALTRRQQSALDETAALQHAANVHMTARVTLELENAAKNRENQSLQTELAKWREEAARLENQLTESARQLESFQLVCKSQQLELDNMATRFVHQRESYEQELVEAEERATALKSIVDDLSVRLRSVAVRG